MPVSNEAMQTWLGQLMGSAPDAPNLPLEKYLDAIPGLSDLAGVPRGTVVLIRGDTDAKPGPKVGDGDIRLQSMVSTLKTGQQQGWIQVVFGHIGRKPEGSLEKVRARLAELLETPVSLVKEWLDESTITLTDELVQAIKSAQPGAVIMLENTRKYGLETVLWKAKPGDIPTIAPKLAKLANEMAEKVAKVYIHEALSAGSLDSSSVVIPAAMEQVALGSYIEDEFRGPMLACRQADVVVFSGLKIDKLDDLEAIVERGQVSLVIAAGSLAMSLKKAAAQVAGGDFNLGVSQDPTHSDKPYYIEPARIEQARKLLELGKKNNVEFVLPIDFVLADGRAVDTMGPADQQFDIGPKTNALFAETVTALIEKNKAQVAAGGKPLVVFHNGVFGMFEDPRFEAGTKEFMTQLKRLTDAGVKVYIGGGEGGAAMERYGQPDWITHCFTAGGTVLNALGSQPIPYLQALYLAKK